MCHIRIALLSNDDDFCKGMEAIFKGQEDIKYIGFVKRDNNWVNELIEYIPDIVMVDMKIMDISAEECIVSINKSCLTASVLLLDEEIDDDKIYKYFLIGVSGYLHRHVGRVELFYTIRLIHTGDVVFRAKMPLNRLHSFKYDSEINGDRILRDREILVLQLASEGKTNKQIALTLNVTENTVATHFVNIFRKLGVQTRTEAVVCALDKGWIKPEVVEHRIPSGIS